MAAILNRSSVKRIGNAVRRVEAAAGRGGSMRGDALPYVLRLAQVTLAVEAAPAANEPYIYEADLYAGHWTDAKALRAAIKEAIEIWSATELAVDDWVSVIRIGEHWELFGAAGGGGEIDPPADPAYYTTLGGNTKGTEAADTGTWTSGDVDGSSNPLGLRFWVQTRQAYYESGNKIWYAYARQVRYTAAGQLYSVSAETRIAVHTPISLAEEF